MSSITRTTSAACPRLLAIILLLTSIGPGQLSARAADAGAEQPDSPDNPDSSDHAIETLVVSASRTAVQSDALAGAVYSIDSATLQQARPTFASDLLRLLPGTAVNRAGGQGAFTQLRVRGAEANQTLVLYDGYQLNDPAIGNEFNFAHLLGNSVDGIELLSGQRSALWGSEAGAGIVNLAPPGAGDQPAGFVDVMAGSFDSRELALGASAEMGRGALALRLGHTRTDGTNVARSGTEQDGYENTSLVLHGRYAATEDVALSSTLYLNDASADIDAQPLNVPVDADQVLDSRQSLVGVRMAIDPAGARHSHRLNLQWLESEHRDLDSGVRTGSRSGRRLRADWMSSLELPAAGLRAQRISVVLEAEQEQFRQRGAASVFGDPNQNQSLQQQGLVLEYRAEIIDGLHMAAIARRDHNDEFDDATTWRGELRWAAPLGDVWLGGGRSIQNPTFTERFGFTPDTFFGNPDLQPERIDGWELGWQHAWLEGRWDASLLLHQSRLRDEINGFAFDAGLGGFTAVNRDGNSKRQGVEASLRWQFNDHATLHLSYSHVDATEDGAGGQTPEVRRPRHSASAALATHWLNDRLSLWLAADWRDSLRDNDFATFPATPVDLDARLLIDGRLSYRVGRHTEVFVRAENLFDTDYEDIFGYGTPGRALYAGVRVSRGG